MINWYERKEIIVNNGNTWNEGDKEIKSLIGCPIILAR